MSQKKEAVAVVIALLFTLVLLIGGVGWFLNSEMTVWLGTDATDSDAGIQVSDRNRTTPIISMTLAEDGRTLATGNYGSTITLWDIETRSPSTLNAHQGRVNSLVMVSGRLVSGSGDGSVRVWDVSSAFEVQNPLSAPARVLSLAPANNGTVAAGYSDGSVRIWDVIGGNLVQNFAAHADQVSGLAFSAGDPTLLVSCSHDATIKVWDLSADVPLELQQIALDSKVTSIDVSADGLLIVSGDYQGRVRFWDLSTGNEDLGRSLPGHTFIIGEVEFSPDDAWLVSTGYDEKIKIWDLRTNTEYRTFDLSPDKAGFIFAAEFLSSEISSETSTGSPLKLLTAGYDGQVRLWDLETGDFEMF